jgi:hypothetical protein
LPAAGEFVWPEGTSLKIPFSARSALKAA